MANNYIVYREKEAIVSAGFTDGTLSSIMLSRGEQDIVSGDIYVGRIEQVVASVKAAFVRVEKEGAWYLPLEKAKCPIVSKTHADGKLHPGDEILVSVEREAGKKKTVSCTADFSLTGCYFVIIHGSNGIHHSKKISEESVLTNCKHLIREVLADCKIPIDFAVMIRTNAAFAEEETMRRELSMLLSKYAGLREQAITRAVGTRVYAGLPGFLVSLRDSYEFEYEEMITDDQELYDSMLDYLKQFRPDKVKELRFYDSSMVSLKNVYDMTAKLDGLLHERVWLKSGGYLVIEQTEAMVVIDVNSGKATVGNKNKDSFLPCNLEAAKEIARQLRLRNLSGIIMIDFIDLKSESEKQELMRTLREAVATDRIRTDVVEMTKLNLVEVTRMKARKTLWEEAKQLGI